MFGQRIEIEVGEVVERDGFAYADIIATQAAVTSALNPAMSP
jgi:hypothetical protein